MWGGRRRRQQKKVSRRETPLHLFQIGRATEGVLRGSLRVCWSRIEGPIRQLGIFRVKFTNFYLQGIGNFSHIRDTWDLPPFGGNDGTTPNLGLLRQLILCQSSQHSQVSYSRIHGTLLRIAHSLPIILSQETNNSNIRRTLVTPFFNIIQPFT